MSLYVQVCLNVYLCCECVHVWEFVYVYECVSVRKCVHVCLCVGVCMCGKAQRSVWASQWQCFPLRSGSALAQCSRFQLLGPDSLI